MKRLTSIDILRGIALAGMLLVNNPGDWGHIYAPLEHAPFIGLTPTDTVRNILSREGVYLKKHLLGGVAKGAFSEEVAEQKFNAWKNDKQKGLEAIANKLAAEKKANEKARLDAEKQVNEAIAQKVAEKKAAEAAAKAEAEAAAKAEAEAPAEAPAAEA